MVAPGLFRNYPVAAALFDADSAELEASPPPLRMLSRRREISAKNGAEYNGIDPGIMEELIRIHHIRRKTPTYMTFKSSK